MKKYTILDFQRDFPDDDACLEHLTILRWPNGITCVKCNRITKHHKIKTRPAYACDVCGTHVYPQAGTVLQDTRTPLRLWFHALFLMGHTRCGISAKQLQRELGVTYKTAWRIFKQIRSTLNEDVMHLLGEVEVDDSYFGARRRGKHGRGAAGKTVVFGMAERRGPVIATVVPDMKASTVLPSMRTKVMPRSIIYSDEYHTYDPIRRMGMGYKHRRIHHAQNVYVRGNVHTNAIEGFWRLVKRGI